MPSWDRPVGCTVELQSRRGRVGSIRAASGRSTCGFDTQEGDPLTRAVHRLTPRECERLQGFPDDYTDVTWRRRNWTPDGPRDKALGNSMAVNVMGWLEKWIETLERIPQPVNA